MEEMTGSEWRLVASFLLSRVINLVEEELLEATEDMKGFDLILRSLGEDGDEDGKGRQVISDALEQIAPHAIGTTIMDKTMRRVNLRQEMGSSWGSKTK